MRVSDLFGLALAALWQQKSRTVMTTLGVVFGSFVLAASLSIGQGVQDTIERESHRSDFLRKISVHPQYRGTDSAAAAKAVEVSGEMSEVKRERIRRAIGEHATGKPVAVTRERISKIAGFDHVEAVVPVFYQTGYAVFDQQSQLTSLAGARPENRDCRRRLVAGQFFHSPHEPAAVVSEYLLYRWGLTDDAGVQGAVGKKLRVELRAPWHQRGLHIQLVRPEGEEATLEETLAIEKIKEQLPAALDHFDLTPDQAQLLRSVIHGKDATQPSVVSEEYTIVGVVRAATAEELKEPWDPLRVGADLILPYETASDLYFRQSGNDLRGVDHAVVVVDDEQYTQEVHQQILALGLTAHTVWEYIEQQKLIYLLIFGGMTCVAAVALLVAALGIANTMLMSVLERTREIGIMKAVGAGNTQLQLVFVIEGAIIGSLGGGLGVLLAWAASIPGDAWVRSMVARGVPVELKDSLFVFPLWLVAVSLSFAVIVTTLAALYPARRAAKIDPVAALRHE